MREFKALIVAHYDFTNKEGKRIVTSKLLVSLGEYGVISLNSPLANDFELLQEVNVQLGFKNDKFIITEVIE